MADEPELASGDSGEWVTYLQQLLAHHGHPTDADGTFGEQTAAGVRAVQQGAGLSASGRADAETWAALTGGGDTGNGGGEFTVNFTELPIVRDGAITWSVRNEGPGTNKGQRDLLTLEDASDGANISVQTFDWTTELQPDGSDVAVVPIDFLFAGTPFHDDTIYRLTVRIHIDGTGDQSIVNFRVEHSQAMPV